MPICISQLNIIGPDNGSSPCWCQAIIWINAGILLIGPLGTNFSRILIEIHTFSFKKMHWKMSSAKWRPFCIGLNVLKNPMDNMLHFLSWFKSWYNLDMMNFSADYLYFELVSCIYFCLLICDENDLFKGTSIEWVIWSWCEIVWISSTYTRVAFMMLSSMINVIFFLNEKDIFQLCFCVFSHNIHTFSEILRKSYYSNSDCSSTQKRIYFTHKDIIKQYILHNLYNTNLKFPIIYVIIWWETH